MDLELPAGKAVAIIGPNGSGKTTLLKCLLGQVVPDAGEIYMNGKAVLRNSAYRSHIGYMSQISRFPENITIGELFTMMKDLRSEVKEYDTDLMTTYKLEEIANKRLGTLSGGTKQKVGAALAFMFRPDVLILDEPTAGLDPAATEHIKDKIHKEKKNGRLVLITSHIMSDIEELADTIVYIMDGKIRLNWPVAKVKEHTGEASFSRAMARLTEECYEK